jgi:hypothetical protein
MWTPHDIQNTSFWFDANDSRCTKRSSNGHCLEIISKHNMYECPSAFIDVTDKGGRIGRLIWDNVAGVIGWEKSWPTNRELIEFYFSQKWGVVLPKWHIGSRFSWPPKWLRG